MVHVSSARGWDLEVDRGPDWLFVRPARRGAAGSDQSSLAGEVWGLLEQTLMHRLVLELDEVGALDPELVEQLLWLQQRIHGHEGIMRICGLSSANEKLLRKLDADGQLALYDNREAAVMCNDRPRHPR